MFFSKSWNIVLCSCRFAAFSFGNRNSMDIFLWITILPKLSRKSLMLQIGSSNEAWLWVATEPIHKQILGVYISRHRNNMIVAEAFLRSLVRIYGKHTVYSDGDGTWYPEACISLGLKHGLYSSYQKSIVVERAIEYLKDRTEAFDDYFPCTRNGLCSLQHIYKWLILFVFMHNSIIIKSNTSFINLRG
jgi:putative transposase